MDWRTLAVVLALAGAPVVAHANPLTRAERALAAYEAGDRAALEPATRAADDAVVSKRLGQDPATWLLRGRVYFARLLDPGSAGPVDPAIATIESFEKAVAQGASGSTHAALSELVPRLEATLQSALVNDVEARAWDSAEARLQTALRARLLNERLRGRDPARDAPLRQLAVQITAELGRASDARTHYEAWAEASGTDNTPLATLVARTMADRGDLEGAITFVGALSNRYPHDEVLLHTEVELLTRSGRIEEAVARVDRAVPVLETSVSGAFVAATLYAAAGREDRARALWARVVALDARHVDARIALGRSLTTVALQRRGELGARSEELETRRPSREILDLLASVKEAWSVAEGHLVAARDLAPEARPPLEALVGFYETRISGLDPEPTERAELLVLEADQQKLESTRAALAALGAG